MKESMVRCWKAADFDGMGRCLSSVDWDTLFTVNFTADTIWKAFSDILDHAINQFVPVKVVRPTTKRNVKHYPRSIKRAIGRKKYLWHRLRDNPKCESVRKDYKLAVPK